MKSCQAGKFWTHLGGCVRRTPTFFARSARVRCSEPAMNASPPTISPVPESDDAIYDRGFWLAYSANLMLVCANSLTFRFAEFVASLGGTEELSGLIVQAGLFAAIFCRLGLGRAIDHYGPRLIWMASAVVYLTGSL